MRISRRVVICTVLAALLFAVPSFAADCTSVAREAASGVSNRVALGVAWSGSVVGVVKTDASFPGAIYFAIYSEDLNPLTTDLKVVDSTFAGVTALLWNGSEFAVFYQQAFTSQLMLLRVSPSGSPIGAAVPIAPNRGSATDREYDVIWDAGRDAYLVANTVTRSQESGLWVTTVNRDGSVRSELLMTPLIASIASPRVAVAANGAVLATFRRADGVYYAEYNADGTFAGIGSLMPAADVVVASNGTSFLAVGSVVGTPNMTMHWAIVDAKGKVTQKDAVLFTPRGIEARPLHLSWNAQLQEWDLSYLDSLLGFANLPGEYRLRRFATDGELFSDGLFTPEILFSNYSSPLAFAWTGTKFVTAGSRPLQPGRSTDTYLFSLCPLTATVVTDRPSVPISSGVTFRAAISGGTQVLSYTWDFGDSVRDQTGQVITHKYERTGEYTVQVRVVDTAGSTSIGRYTIRVYAPRTRSVRRP